MMLACAVVAAIGGPAVKGLFGNAQDVRLTLRDREENLYNRQQQRIVDLEAALEKAQADAKLGWALMRGWMLLAHDLRHSLLNLVQKFNLLLKFCRRVAFGEVELDTARDRIKDFEEMEAPPDLPEAEGIEPRGPGETPYA